MRWVLALLAGLLLASLGWLWLDPGQPAAPPSSGQARIDRDAHSPGAAADGGLTPFEAEATAVHDAGDEAEDDEGAADERLDATAGSQGGPVLRVVRGPNADPVADADVWFLSERELEQRNAGRQHGVDRIDGPEQFGQRRRTGADGRIELPRGRERWLVSAQKEDEFGFALAWSRRREQVLTLVGDERLVIEAAYANETPARVPLLVMQQLGRGGGGAEAIWRGESDAAGRAVVRHFQLRRRELPQADGSEPAAPAEQFAVLAEVPSQHAALTRFAGRPVQREVVQLVVPATGSVAIRLVDHAGRPLLTPALVAVGPSGEQQTDGFAIGWNSAHRADKPAGATPVVLGPIATQDPVIAFARYPEERRGGSTAPVRGPDQPGGVVQVDLPPRDNHCVLAGRVLGPDRVALVEPKVRLVIWHGDRVLRTADLHPIADGNFDLVVSGNNEAGPFRAELRAAAAGSADQPTDIELGVSLPMQQWPGGQRVELGTFVLQPLPALAAGVVVDDRTEVISGAQVTVQQLVGMTPAEPRNAGNPRNLRAEENGRPSAPQQNQERWQDLPGLRTRTADDGTFAIFGELPPGRLRVRADSDLHFADTVPLAAANRTLQIRIARNGIVRGRVLLPGWLAEGAVAVTLRPLDESQRESNTRRAEVSRRGGRFTLEPLQPGRYDLLVTMRSWPAPLLTMPDVFVQPGENDDARLRVIDLREALFRYRLRALDEAAQLLPLDGPILARLQQPDGNWIEAAFRWQSGRAELITAATMLTVKVFGRGIETLETQLMPGDQDLRLRTLRPALIEVPGARALCGPDRKVRISVILQGDTGLPSAFGGIDQRTGQRFSLQRWDLGRSSGGWLGNSDVVEVPLMVAGKYEVLLRPHATDSTNSTQGSVSLGEHELRPDGSSLTTVRVDSQAVLEALARLDEQQRQRSGNGGGNGGGGRQRQPQGR